ncbi:MAG: F0F1 ATP synthase subunit A [Patescibacteria group bacterium]
MADRSNNSTGLKMSFAALAAEPLFNIGQFTVTNSLLNAWISVAAFCVVAFIASRRKTIVPRGVHNLIEAVIEGLLSEVQKVTGDRKRALMFFPVVATLFLYILVNNWMGLLPGTGTIGWTGGEHGFLPLFRPAAADLNFTLAIAVFSVAIVQIAGVKATGLVNYGSKFMNIRGIFLAIPKGPTAIAVAIIEFGVGLIEIVSEFAKIVSLSLRLFGNVFAGEILIGVMMSLFSFVLPIPFMFLEILVGAIQATVFSILVLAFLTVATDSHGHGDEEHHEAKAH